MTVVFYPPSGHHEPWHFETRLAKLPEYREHQRDTWGTYKIEFWVVGRRPQDTLHLVELAWYNRKVGEARWAEILRLALRPEKE